MIEITAVEPHVFRVEVRDGRTSTTHWVRVPETMVDDLGLGDVDLTELVRESFEFLLEREPATSILREFSLDVIARYFPSYDDEIKLRVGRA
jgi:hypothetical protein